MLKEDTDTELRLWVGRGQTLQILYQAKAIFTPH